jgi:hypothetical protein
MATVVVPMTGINFTSAAVGPPRLDNHHFSRGRWAGAGDDYDACLFAAWGNNGYMPWGVRSLCVAGLSFMILIGIHNGAENQTGSCANQCALAGPVVVVFSNDRTGHAANYHSCSGIVAMGMGWDCHQ